MDIDNKPQQVESKCPISKLPSLFKFLITQFTKFYSLRALIGLIKFLIFQRGYKKPNLFQKILSTLFNTSNLRTGLFLSLMPFLYELIPIFFNPNKKKLVTFIAGFISSLVGILISEKNDVMTFVILSVFIRSLHSAIQVLLKEKGYPTESRVTSYTVFWIACFGFLFLSYCHPSYAPIDKLFSSYAIPTGKELEELNTIRNSIKLI
jgi:hypothetical protein